MLQVHVEGNQKGCLTVDIKGPWPRSVSEIDIIYTGHNHYEVLYEVQIPGTYLITLKWSERLIGESPYICTID